MCDWMAPYLVSSLCVPLYLTCPPLVCPCLSSSAISGGAPQGLPPLLQLPLSVIGIAHTPLTTAPGGRHFSTTALRQGQGIAKNIEEQKLWTMSGDQAY